MFSVQQLVVLLPFGSEKSSYGDEGERPNDQHDLYLVPRAGFCPQVLVEALRGRVFLTAGANVFPFLAH